MTQTVFDDLEQIQRRPGMYIGNSGVTGMRTFLDGYRMAVGLGSRRLCTKNGIPLDYLHYYIARNYRQSASMGWANILREAAGSEQGGLELFFRELEGFKAITILKVEEPLLTPEARQMYLVTLSDGATLLVVEREGGLRVEFNSLFSQGEPKRELERRFGPLEWRLSGEDFLGEKVLAI